MLPAETAPAANVPDLCPIVPAACILDVGEAAVDNVNPFNGFWDAFFVSSPAEAIESPLQLIWAVPRPDFNAEWFRDAYSNTLAFYGIGISILMLLVSLAWSSLPGNSNVRGFVYAFTDWITTLFQVAFAPMFSALVLWISATLGLGVLGWVDVDDPADFLDFFSTNYFAVGWMSLAVRLVGIFLMVEVIAIYLIQVFATLSAPVIIPLRSAGDWGRMWYVRMVRGMLLGFAPLIMSFTLAAFVFLLQHIPSFGSTKLFEFVGALTALGLAAYLPLKIAKISKEVVSKGALRLAETRVVPDRAFSRAFEESSSQSSLRQYMDRRRDRRQGVTDLVGDAAKIGLAAYTGGASAAALTASQAKSRSVGRTMDAYRRSQSYRDQMALMRKRGNDDGDS